MRRLTVLLAAVLVVSPGLARAAGDEADPVGEWPLRPVPEVVHGFDPPSSTWGAGHRGVDLLGRPGQRVHAALAGTVSFVGTIAGRGVVTVDHGPTRTTYEPVTSSLEVGTSVGPGDPLGRLAYPGSHCAPSTCLHWGWIKGDTYLDPLRLVGAGPVRLLPLQGLPVAHHDTYRWPWVPFPTPYDRWRPAHVAGGLGALLGRTSGESQPNSPTTSSR